MVDDETLLEWERLCNEATPGPWLVGDRSPACCYEDNHVIGTTPEFDHTVFSRVLLRFNTNFPATADSAFVAAAREGWPEAIAEIKRLKGRP